MVEIEKLLCSISSDLQMINQNMKDVYEAPLNQEDLLFQRWLVDTHQKVKESLSLDSKADVNSIGISLSDNKPRSNDTGLSNGTSSIFQFSILDFIDSVSQILIFGTIIGLMNSPNQSNNDQQITLKDILAGIPPSIVHFIIEGLDTSCPYLIKNSIEVMINKNLESIMQNFANRTIDFIFNQIYPMFLQIYDQTVKKDLGIVYTPSEVVNFMVSAVDFLLKSKFNIDNGIIGQSIHYYDPSVGTFAFPIGFLNIAHKQYFDPKSQDSINSINREDFSSWFNSTFLQDDKRINSFKVIDIQFVSLALGELRIKMRARELGIEIEKTGTFNILLCNPMEDGNIFFDTKTQSAKITKNNNNADNKATNNNNQFNNTTRVIITNPPYNVSSKNNSKWITRLMKDYTDPESLRREPGKPTAKPIRGLSSAQDDYWKFMRIAQWIVDQPDNDGGQSIGGIVSLITNNFYIDGLAARGLRKHYRRTFDEIWVVNLHGDWKKKRHGTKTGQRQENPDENIFNVNCGIAIIFAIKYPELAHRKNKDKDPFACIVKYYELFGSAESKLLFLENTHFSKLSFSDVQERLDWEFTPIVDTSSTTQMESSTRLNLDKTYYSFPYLCDIFIKSINGIKTGHDHELMHYSKSETEQLVKDLYKKYGDNPPDLPKISWNPRKILNADLAVSLTRIIEWNWRGFDKRWICYDPILMQSHRFSLMQYLLPDQNNLCLIINRQSRGKAINKASSYFVSTTIFDNMCNEGASGLHSHAFPLRINYSTEPDSYDNPKKAIHPNINPEFMKSINYWDFQKLSEKEIDEKAEQVFCFVYAVLYAEEYRKRYKHLLSKDFPRIPFPDSAEIFMKLSDLGKELINIQTFKKQNTGTNTTNGINSNIKEIDMNNIKIKKFGWIPDNSGNNGTICFNTKSDANRNQIPDEKCLCIYEIPKSAWEFEIGGIEQLKNWLSARKYNDRKDNQRYEPGNEQGDNKKSKPNKFSRTMRIEELNELLSIINAIIQTIEIKKDINSIFNSIQEWRIITSNHHFKSDLE